MNKNTVNIGLINPKSPSNVGAVMRAAGCYQVDAVFYSGARFDRAVKFHTDTHNSRLNIPLIGVENVLDAVAEEMEVVCVELVEGAISLPEYQHPQNAFYIFGPEDGSISQKVVDKAGAVVYVPTRGCLNLAATVNVLLYDRLFKSKSFSFGDEFIRQSRDVRNKLRIK